MQPKDDAIAKDVRRTPGEKEQPKEGTVLFDTHGAYLDAPRNVAKELGVTFIDMNKITHDLVQGLGPVESKKLFMFVEPNQAVSYTHLDVYKRQQHTYSVYNGENRSNSTVVRFVPVDGN